MLLLLVLVLQLGPQHRARNGANDAVPAHLVPAKVSCGAAAQRAHQAAVALSLRIRVRRAVALLVLLLAVLALGILVLGIAALLRELLRGGLARVGLLVVAAWR